jgi:hypothetical protein
VCADGKQAFTSDNGRPIQSIWKTRVYDYLVAELQCPCVIKRAWFDEEQAVIHARQWQGEADPVEKVQNDLRDLLRLLFTYFKPSLEGDFGWVTAYRARQ